MLNAKSKEVAPLGNDLSASNRCVMGSSGEETSVFSLLTMSDSEAPVFSILAKADGVINGVNFGKAHSDIAAPPALPTNAAAAA